MDDLYSETLLDHYNHPHHAGVLHRPSARIVKHNPLCGDVINLDIVMTKDAKIRDVAFTGTGCALSQAGMSLLSEQMIGRTSTELGAMTSATMDSLLGIPVSPGRRTCADLGMSAVKEALLGIVTHKKIKQ